MRIAVAILALVALPTPALADEPLASLELTPWARYDGEDRPYRYIVEVRPAGSAPVDVVADRRLLTFSVHDGRRRLRCRHPAAPSRVQDARVRTLRPGAPEEGAWREWVDLRMYCTGRARRALEQGAEVDVEYGWPRRTRTRWVARTNAQAPWREWVGNIEAPPITFPAQPSARTAESGREGPPPIEIELAPATARTGESLVLRTSIRAREGAHRLYERPDAWSFRVRGPIGTVSCRAEMGGGSPPPDLFQRVTPRRRVRESLDADFFCPEGTFQVAGVYEVTPKVRLPHSGEEEWGLSAVTGRFTGPSVPIRITVGDRSAYVEQIPERAAEAPFPERRADAR